MTGSRLAEMQVGPYALLPPIGESGMGEVWKARDTRRALLKGTVERRPTATLRP